MAKVATFVDDFTTADTAKWTFSATVGVTAGQLVVPCTSSYLDAASVNTYDLTSSSVFVRLVGNPAVGTGTTESIFAFNNATDDVRFKWDAGSLVFTYRVAGGAEQFPGSVTYDPVAHAWLRLSESAGTVTWSTSPDCIVWTTRTTAAAGWTTLTASVVHLISGYYGTETSPGSTTFDSLNVAPIVSVAPPYPGLLVSRLRPYFG